MNQSKFQSWNRRSKKWVLFEGGQIKDMQPEKFSGVPVKKDKPGFEAVTTGQENAKAEKGNRFSLF